MLETKLSTVIYIPLGDIETIEKRGFSRLLWSGGAKTEEPLRGGGYEL